MNLRLRNTMLLQSGEIIRKVDIDKDYGHITIRTIRLNSQYYQSTMLNGEVIAIKEIKEALI